MSTQILTVSSKGQISLPVSIRKLLSIDTGDKLVAYIKYLLNGDVLTVYDRCSDSSNTLIIVNPFFDNMKKQRSYPSAAF